MAAPWRVARSLDVLLFQLNLMAPNRNKRLDGAIGDEAHQAQGRASDHNPWFGPGIVTARDFTHDPAGGLDCDWLANMLVKSRDPRIKYVIWRGRLIDSRPQFNPWEWRSAADHHEHLHLSVMDNFALADDKRPWNLVMEDDVSADDVWLNFHPIGPDGVSKYNANDFLWHANNNTWELRKELAAQTAQITGLAAAVTTLAAGLDNADEIEEAVRSAIEDGVLRVRVELDALQAAQTPTGEPPA